MIHSTSIAFVFVAGLASVLSPCVLPVIPIIVTGGPDDHRLRPLLIVAGLALTFVLMGVVSSLFASVIGAPMRYVEKAAGILITLFGVLLILNVNLFKHLGFLSALAQLPRGGLGGFILGAILGIVWIPCVGPALSSVLALVATQGKVFSGILLLLVYSLGFAIPMLIAGYASQSFRKMFSGAKRHPYLVNLASGLILMAMGLFVVFKGMIGFGSL
jgi:cytochrome c-type biogenesis protein